MHVCILSVHRNLYHNGFKSLLFKEMINKSCVFYVGANISIVYTDYDNLMVYSICWETNENNCTRPGAAFMSRTQKPRLEDLRKGQEVIKDLCVKPKAFLDKIQDVGNKVY